MSAQAAGPVSWAINEESEESTELRDFKLKCGHHLTALSDVIGKAFAEGDGNTIVLLDCSLRALLDIIADGLQRHRIKIEVEEV